MIQVFQIGEGGLGGELHLYRPNEPIELKKKVSLNKLNLMQIQLKHSTMQKGIR